MAVKVKQHTGAWWIFINYHGKRKAKRIGSSKRAAEMAAEKIQAKIALGETVSPSSLSAGHDKQNAACVSSYSSKALIASARAHSIL